MKNYWENLMVQASVEKYVRTPQLSSGVLLLRCENS